MTTYYALTIGPIYKSMAMAIKTRELWAASYMFSHLMESLVTELRPFGEIILPVPSLEPPSQNGNPESGNKAPLRVSAGLFPDRLIIKNINGKSKYSDFKLEIEKVKQTFIDNLSFANSASKKYFSSFFHIYSLEIIVSKEDNPINIIIPILDSLELNPAFVPTFKKHAFIDLFRKLPQWKPFEAVFGEKFRFPSVLEISSTDLKEAPNPKIPTILNNFCFDEKNVYDAIFDYCLEKENDKNVKNHVNPISLLKEAYNPSGASKDDERFRFYHKYMAIVQADGDNFGLAINALHELGGSKAVQEFSKLLMEFGKEAAKKILVNKGSPIYMGGDDLLFFSPVKYESKTIFHLIRDLDTLFRDKLQNSESITNLICDWNASITKENKRKKVELSISYGVSIAYQKFPLKESLETARNLLFKDAKMLPDKDAIAYKVLKNSGQYYGAITCKKWKAHEDYFLKLLDTSASWNNRDKETNFITSLQYKLQPLKPILSRILSGRDFDLTKESFLDVFERHQVNEKDREKFLINLKDNFFNEYVHKKDDTSNFLELSFTYLLQLYRNLEDVYGNSKETTEKAIDTLYATLRFVQFINQPDNNEMED